MIYDLDFSDCKNEQQFKMKFIKTQLSKIGYTYIFPIETEETVKGFPDVMAVSTSFNFLVTSTFYEFKISDKSGKIKFQPTQPAFYKSHNDMGIQVVALNKKSGKVHTFCATDIFCEGSDYRINEKAEVNLCKGEKNESISS